MKKFNQWMLTAILICGATSVMAQNGYDDTRHEIAISYGAGSNSQIIDDLEEVLVAPAGARFGDDNYIGPISVEYFYRLKPWLGVGGIFVYGHNKQDMTIDGKDEGKRVNAYYTVMPAVKFDWLRKTHYGLYSKLGIGLTLRTEKVDDSPSISSDTKSQTHLNWQASLIGFEAGSPRVRGFVELGVGEQGIGLIGLRCKF